ncbi:MAG: TldD/PmbA family protein [Candidatus Riflebacteria bacterium]
MGFAADIINSFKNRFNSYTELRAQTDNQTSISLDNGKFSPDYSSSQSGISARVFNHGAWGFAAIADISEKNAALVIEQADKNAKFLASKLTNGEPDLTSTASTDPYSYRVPGSQPDSKIVKDYLKQIDEWLTLKCPDLSNRSINVQCNVTDRDFITAGQGLISVQTVETLLILNLSLKKNGKSAEVYSCNGGSGYLFDLFGSSIEEKIDLLIKQLSDKSDAIPAESGTFPCVLCPSVTGILAHEAVGHTIEADNVNYGTAAAGSLNRQVASPLVTMVDFAHTAFGKTCPAPVLFDDEGILGTDAVIIENGILKTFLHNRQSARQFAEQPRGNARARLFSDEPIIRMRNMAIVPGKQKLDEMIASIDQGYLLVDNKNGQADAAGNFSFGTRLGYEIINGKIGRAISDTTVSGNAFEVLQSVDMVSDDFELFPKRCGKKQTIAVSWGGPSIKCRLKIGGGK